MCGRRCSSGRSDRRLTEKLFGSDVKHTIEPEVKYRYVTGINNFRELLRFDAVDVASNTNELEYGVTQRLFLRPGRKKPCPTEAAAASGLDGTPDQSGAAGDTSVPETETTGRAVETPIRVGETAANCGGREWISWRLTQKYFFDPSFGGAVVAGRRNIFDTTLALSGIAFLTEPRDISPLVSRMRVRTSAKMDVEWDFDLDTGAKKFTGNNVLIDVHQGNGFAGLSYARLNAPGRFYTQGIASAVSNFNQLRVLVGYGAPTKPGLGVAANAGIDARLGLVAICGVADLV